MKKSIKIKLFSLCILLVLITSISISTPFYLLVKQDKELMGYYELYLNTYITESGKHKKAIADLKAYNDLLEDHRILLNMYNIQLLKAESSTELTSNEKLYRDLSDEEKSHYDSKASLVLKSFEWKRRDSKRKEEFEIINCNN